MRNRMIWALALVSLILIQTPAFPSTRKERRLITEGNKKYTEREFVEAEGIYEEALKINPGSTAAIYNLGLSLLRQVANPADTTPKNIAILEKATKNFQEAASRSKDRPGIAAKANYNLGNLEFHKKEYAKAIEYYKQALRIDPEDESTRKNLRIAQKQLENQNKDKNKNQDKNQEQNQQDKNKDKNENQNQQDQQNNQDQQKNKQQEDKNINQQTAEQILQAMDTKENQTRARVNRANKGDKSVNGGRARKRW